MLACRPPRPPPPPAPALLSPASHPLPFLHMLPAVLGRLVALTPHHPNSRTPSFCCAPSQARTGRQSGPLPLSGSGTTAQL